MAEFIPALAWTVAIVGGVGGAVSLTLGHLKSLRQHPKPRYRRTRAEFG